MAKEGKCVITITRNDEDLQLGLQVEEMGLEHVLQGMFYALKGMANDKDSDVGEFVLRLSEIYMEDSQGQTNYKEV